MDEPTRIRSNKPSEFARIVRSKRSLEFTSIVRSKRSLEFERIVKAVLMFLAIALTCIVLYMAFCKNLRQLQLPTPPLRWNQLLYHKVIYDEYYELRKVLKEASTKEKVVILATLNEAWAEPNSVYDLFMKSFRIGENITWILNHLVIIAINEKAYTRCHATHSHCYLLESTKSNELAHAASYMTSNYLELIWERVALLRTVLELGYDFIVTDVDIVWFRNPFPHFDRNLDIHISCDRYIRGPYDVENWQNVGFMFVRSNNRTIKFYNFWLSSRWKYPHLHEQDVFNFIKRSSFLKENGLKIKFLDTTYFGGFCRPSRDFNKVCTMHANCCVGLHSKVVDLNTTLEDWMMYKSFGPNQTSHQFRWRVPNLCSV